MAKIGVSQLHAAKYAESGGAITYSDCAKLAVSTKLDLNIESAGDNVLFGDNGPTESDKSFGGGTVKATVADIDQDKMALLMGITAVTRTVGSDTVSELIYDDDRNPPDMGVGFVIKKQVAGVIKWRAIVLNKVKFGVPAVSVETQGKTVSFQTDELEADILRDDSEKGAWMHEATLATEAKAVAYIKNVLGVTA